MLRVFPGNRAPWRWGLLAGVGMLVAAGCATRPASRPSIYPADASPAATIEAARAEAARTGRRVLLNFGANWCSDSQAMYRRLTQDPRVEPLVRERYVMVLVDVGPRGGPGWDSAVVREYGRPFAERGIPALVVLGEDGRPLIQPGVKPLRDSDHRRPRRVARFLEESSRRTAP